MRRAVCVWLVAALGALGACGGDNTADDDDDVVADVDAAAVGTGIADECNPLGGVACMLPFPSSAYLDADATSATGYRVHIPPAAAPINQDGIALDPTPFNRYDGFTGAGQIVVAFDTGVQPDNLPHYSNIPASLAADAPIVLLDMDTGERLPYFAETDMNADRDEERALLIRPLVKIPGSHRVAVAIRKSVHAADGSALPIPPGFQALLDDAEFPHPLMDKIRPRYVDIFAALETAGVAKDDLVLAWDYVTASQEFLTADLTTMRDVAVETMGVNGANLTFDAEEQPTDDGRVLHYYIGTYDSPMFLDAGESDLSKLARGADGLPELQGTYRANFAALVPACAADAALPLPVLVFGHGLFGNGQDYLDGGLLRKVANDACVVVVAGDFIGLTNRQLTVAAFAMNDLNRGPTLTEKLAQSIINFIALEQIVRGPMAEDPRFQIDGVSVIDPTRVYYYGASLGGIMGNLFMAYDPFITRGVLGVPGANWTMLLERSLPWPALQSAMKGAYPNPWDYELNIALIGMAWDPYDPITTSANVIHDPLPGVPAKQLLLQEAMDDCLVTNVATEMTARMLGIPVLTPSVRGVPWGLEETAGPASSALARYDEHPQPPPPSNDIPPAVDNGTHSGVHDNEALQRQVREFLLEGEVRNECRQDEQPSACDCAALECL